MCLPDISHGKGLGGQVCRIMLVCFHAIRSELLYKFCIWPAFQPNPALYDLLSQAKSICADGRPYILEPSVNKGNLDLFHFYDSWYTKWCWWKFMVRLSNFYDFSKKTQFAWMLWFLRNRQFIRILRFLQFPRFPRFPGWNTLITRFSYVLVFTKCQILSHSCQMWLSGVWKGVVVSWC